VGAFLREERQLAVRLRLARTGKKKQPHYRIVAADARVPRDGRFLEILGWYDPRNEPSTFEVDLDAVHRWIERGATPSERVAKLVALAESPSATEATKARADAALHQGEPTPAASFSSAPAAVASVEVASVEGSSGEGDVIEAPQAEASRTEEVDAVPAGASREGDDAETEEAE